MDSRGPQGPCRLFGAWALQQPLPPHPPFHCCIPPPSAPTPIPPSFLSSALPSPPLTALSASFLLSAPPICRVCRRAGLDARSGKRAWNVGCGMRRTITPADCASRDEHIFLPGTFPAAAFVGWCTSLSKRQEHAFGKGYGWAFYGP